MANGLRADAERFAKAHGLSPDVVMAVIQVESGERRYAFRPEPDYGYLWDNRNKKPFRKLTREEAASEFPPDDFTDIVGATGANASHEWWGQQISWGYMQVMGAVAREFGFKERYLPHLMEPGYNLEYGCALLGALLRWANGDVTSALAAYNGGRVGNRPEDNPKRNQAYVNRVMSEMRRA